MGALLSSLVVSGTAFAHVGFVDPPPVNDNDPNQPMTPAKVEPLKNPSVKKFHDRFGQHLHSIAWYVDDVQAISTQLDQAGFRLFNIVGKQVKPPHKAAAVWTHPRETPGQLEFAVYGDNLADPRMKPGWSSDRWGKHALGIEGASSIGIVVADLASTPALVDIRRSGWRCAGTRCQPRSFSRRPFSRAQSRSFSVWRLSAVFLPRAKARRSFARP